MPSHSIGEHWIPGLPGADQQGSSGLLEGLHANGIQLTICGTGPLKHHLDHQAQCKMPVHADTGFVKNPVMTEPLCGADEFVHSSVMDSESPSLIERMASGLVSIISDSDSDPRAARQFA